jgi:hypothetical protein
MGGRDPVGRVARLTSASRVCQGCQGLNIKEIKGEEGSPLCLPLHIFLATRSDNPDSPGNSPEPRALHHGVGARAPRLVCATVEHAAEPATACPARADSAVLEALTGGMLPRSRNLIHHNTIRSLRGRSLSPVSAAGRLMVSCCVVRLEGPHSSIVTHEVMQFTPGSGTSTVSVSVCNGAIQRR